MLLNVVPSTPFDDLKSFKGTLFETYRHERQLLLDDLHLQQALLETSETSMAARPHLLRPRKSPSPLGFVSRPYGRGHSLSSAARKDPEMKFDGNI